jgi:two-component system KDP operon response regulator KdpE
VPPTEFLGKTVEEIIPPDIAAAVMKTIATCIRTGQTETLEYQLAQDGETRDFEARVVAIGGDEVMAIVRDCTFEKRQLRALGAPARPEGPLVTRTGERPCVLAVDGDVRSLRLVRRLLEDAGKRPLVTADPDEALQLVETERPDLVLIDISVFEDDEANIFGELRRFSEVPVVVFGSSEEAEGGVRALKAGADDYITRPFSPAELDARVELALRHHHSMRPVSVAPMEFGELVIDQVSRSVTVCGERVVLTLTEYKLLLELAEAAGRVLTHDEILERVWGPGYAGQYEVLRAFIRTLRQKLGDDARQPRYVISERGVGYRMVKG